MATVIRNHSLGSSSFNITGNGNTRTVSIDDGSISFYDDGTAKVWLDLYCSLYYQEIEIYTDGGGEDSQIIYEQEWGSSTPNGSYSIDTDDNYTWYYDNEYYSSDYIKIRIVAYSGSGGGGTRYSGTGTIDIRSIKPKSDKYELALYDSVDSGDYQDIFTYQASGWNFEPNCIQTAANGGATAQSFRIELSHSSASLIRTSGSLSTIFNTSSTISSSQISGTYYRNACTTSDDWISGYLICYSCSAGSSSSTYNSKEIYRHWFYFPLYGQYTNANVTLTSDVNRIEYSRLTEVDTSIVKTLPVGGGQDINYFVLTSTSQIQNGTTITAQNKLNQTVNSSITFGRRYPLQYLDSNWYLNILQTVGDSTAVYTFTFYEDSSGGTAIQQTTLTFNYTFATINLSAVYPDNFKNNPSALYIGSTAVKGVFKGDKQVWPEIKTIYLSNPTCTDLNIKLTYNSSNKTVTASSAVKCALEIHYRYEIVTGSAYGVYTYDYYDDYDTFTINSTSLTLSHYAYNDDIWFRNQEYNITEDDNNNYYISGKGIKYGCWKFTLRDENNNVINVGSSKIYCADNAFKITYSNSLPASGNQSFISNYIPNTQHNNISFGYLYNDSLYLADNTYLPVMPINNMSISGITTSTTITPANASGYCPTGYLTNMTFSINTDYYSNLTGGDTSKINLFNYNVIKPKLTTYRYELVNNTSWTIERGDTYEWDFNSSFSISITPSGNNSSNYRIFDPILVESNTSTTVYFRYATKDLSGLSQTNYDVTHSYRAMNTTTTWKINDGANAENFSRTSLNKSTNVNLGSSTFTLTIKATSSSKYYRYYNSSNSSVYCQIRVSVDITDGWLNVYNNTSSNLTRSFSDLPKPTSLSSTKKFEVYIPYFSGYGTKSTTSGMFYAGIFTLTAKVGSPQTAKAVRGALDY